jgi:hypothetical protein
MGNQAIWHVLFGLLTHLATLNTYLNWAHNVRSSKHIFHHVVCSLFPNMWLWFSVFLLPVLISGCPAAWLPSGLCRQINSDTVCPADSFTREATSAWLGDSQLCWSIEYERCRSFHDYIYATNSSSSSWIFQGDLLTGGRIWPLIGAYMPLCVGVSRTKKERAEPFSVQSRRLVQVYYPSL